jgi:thiol-disulfide isomerase/thioredoxin
MKTKSLLSFAVSSVILTGSSALFAADPQTPPAPPAPPAAAAASATVAGPKEDLQALVQKIQAKIQSGKHASGDYASELKEFDGLLEKYKGQKSDDVAQILMMKAMLYVQIFEQPETGIQLVAKLKTEFPETKLGQAADGIIEKLQGSIKSQKLQKELVVGKAFPDFDEKDLDGKKLSVSGYKGKVLLVDFWATWCGPCVGELPNVLKTYEKYHGKGFEIVGISLDKEHDALTGFIKDKKVAWRQYFDGKGWENKLAQQYGIQSIPATFLLDGQGNIIGRDLRGDALGEAVGKALGAN